MTLPVELDKNTFMAEISVPKPVPAIIIVPLRVGLAEAGVRDWIIGAEAAPSV